MKPKIPASDSWILPKETPAQKTARRRKLKKILKAGLGMTPAELKASLRPGYAETYRSYRKFSVGKSHAR